MAVFFHPPASGPRSLALALAAFVQLVAFGGPGTFVAPHVSVRMHVGPAIHPRPVPARVVDEHTMGVPNKPVHAPSPRAECHPQGHAKAEADGAANKKTRPRWCEHDQRVVVGN